MAVEAEAMVIQTRQLLANFFGFTGSANRIVFTANITDSLNMAIAGLVGPGEHLVTTRLEHNAVLRTARHLSRDHDLTLTQVAVDHSGLVSAEAIDAAVQTNTRAIVINHASNVTGRVQPLQAIADVANKHKVPLVVDTAQTAGVLPIDMSELGVSILTFTGHKGLFGPMGIGGMIVAEGVEPRVTKYGGNGLLSESEFQPDAWPHRHEVGTVALPAIAGLHAAQRWFNALGASLASPYGLTHAEQARTLSVALDEDALDAPLNAAQHRLRSQDAVKHIHRTELEHLNRLRTALKRYPHVSILADDSSDDNPMDNQVSTLSFVSSQVSTERIAVALDADYHVCLRAGLHCAPLVHEDAGTLSSGGAVRLAPGYFTDEQDMQQLLDGLEDVLG